MKRIMHFLNTVQTSWSEDPAARGAAKMTAGAVLVAEGVFGVIRNAASGKRGKGGLVGGIIGVVFGGVFVMVGVFMAPGDIEDQVMTQGTIVDVVTGRDSDGDIMHRGVYAFEVEGREYRFNSSVRTSSRPIIGDSIDVAYSAADPRNAQRADGFESKFHWIFIGAGGLVVLTSLFSLVISVVLIGFGIWLFVGGRADRRSAGETGRFLSDLMSIASQARSGQIDVESTAAGQKGRSQGDIRPGAQ